MTDPTDAALDALLVSLAEGETWVIELRPLKSNVPARLRVRGLLKVALRQYHLRAISVRPGPTPAKERAASVEPEPTEGTP